uniref:Uncharacterized protein n=1 Tax=Chrysotila carterae TaxID=13221 RepID=A0A6S9XHZ7_CHRCT
MTLRPWLFSTFNFRRLFAVRRTLGDQCKLFHARPACALVIRDEWNTQRIRNLGVLYAIPDFVSLFLVSRMAFSTKLHHVCVVVFVSRRIHRSSRSCHVCQYCKWLCSLFLYEKNSAAFASAVVRAQAPKVFTRTE